MSYAVNKTDGTQITVLDGTINTSTSISLIGRLAENFGEKQNENFLHLLENFSFTTSPPNPISGQLWYDRNTENLKVYTTGNAWVSVGSAIVGNISLSGNLLVGPNGFRITDLGNVSITNFSNNANIALFSNVAGTLTNVLNINGNTGLITVSANATNNFGVTTKLYVDSEITRASSVSDTNLLANVAIINANLVARINAEDSLRANITAANAQIALRDSITRVNSLNDSTNLAIQANVANIEANLVQRVNQTSAVETAMLANIAIVNANVSAANASISALDSKINSVNTAIEIAQAANLALKADLNSPIFTGVPAADTATFGANTTQLATTQYVMIRSKFWDGSRKFVSTADPSVSDGTDGDIWFKYIP